MNPEQPLSVKDVQTALRCHKNTVWNLLKRGSFPNAWKLGDEWRIPRSDLETYIASRRRFPVASNKENANG